MRKIIMLMLALLLTASLCFSVNAANSATSAQCNAAVSSDGSCQVSMILTVHLEQPADKLYFPVSAKASGVSLNGSRVRAPKSGDIRKINLSRVAGNATGDFSFNIQYSLRDVIHSTDTGTQELQLPLLNGFPYTIETMEFTVTLPGAVEAKPAFVSGYHQSSIEADLNCTVDGMTVTASSLRALKDHETLTMTLPVSEELFPLSIVQTQSVASAAVAMGICGALALVYWLLFLRYLPLRKHDAKEPPEGFDAGSLGCVTGMQGVDLSMTVLSWAQLGYITIHRDRGRRVLLYKRMEMGNERCELEQRWFKKLFGSKQTVDTGSYSYAMLCRALASRPARVQELVRPRTGSAAVFRVLASGVGMFGGAGIGLVMGSGAFLQVLLILLLGALGALSGWVIQAWAAGVLLRRKDSLVFSLVLCAVWLLLALSVGEFTFGLWMVGGLLVAGLLLRIGGLRTPLGKQTAAQITGFRWYLYSADPAQLRQRCETDPDYFFRMAPYAMALGADKAFARRFKGLRLGACPYVTGTTAGPMTAMQWCGLLRQTVAVMEDRARKLPLEKFLGIIHSIIKR